MFKLLLPLCYSNPFILEYTPITPNSNFKAQHTVFNLLQSWVLQLSYDTPVRTWFLHNKYAMTTKENPQICLSLSLIIITMHNVTFLLSGKFQKHYININNKGWKHMVRSSSKVSWKKRLLRPCNRGVSVVKNVYVYRVIMLRNDCIFSFLWWVVFFK